MKKLCTQENCKYWKIQPYTMKLSNMNYIMKNYNFLFIDCNRSSLKEPDYHSSQSNLPQGNKNTTTETIL